MEISTRTSKMGSSNISCLNDGSIKYGREEKKGMDGLTELLLSDDCNNRNVTVLCMVGPSGIGKTTKVQYSYTHKKVKDSFNTRIFIGMCGEKFEEKRLMKEMIESLTCTPCDITEPTILEEALKDELMDKKLLLVLDNVANEKRSFWDHLWVLLNVVAKGSAVIVTTSRKEVADITGAMHCYQLDYLSDSNCWLIFQQLAFNVTNPNSKPELASIGKRLVSMCEHNILCIKMLGGLLSYYFTEEGWRSVLVLLESDFLGLDKSGRDISPVLRVCYDFLPSHLKKCFAYSSLFPKGFIFSKHHLVRFWLSQGFIEPATGKEIEDVGLEYFEVLCCRNFFHHSPLHDARDDAFTMHELIHDLAHYVSKNKYFRSVDCSYIIPEDVHHFSLVPAEYQTATLDLITEKATDLQSFLVINKFMFQQDSTMSPVLTLEGLNYLFVKFSNLRTLDLSNTDLEKLPSSINLLIQLFYLGLSKTNITSIPSEIDKLINLQTLEAKGCYYLVDLPESITALSNLINLDVSKDAGFVGMPVGIGKLIGLQSLAAFNVGSDNTHCRIQELSLLNNLKGRLQISGLENVKIEQDANCANLKSKKRLESLCLQWSDNTVLFAEDDANTEHEENVLKNLEPSDNLQELIIRNYVGRRFPSWIGDRSFCKLVSIIFDSCPNCSELPSLGALPLLRYLSMQKLYEVGTMEVAEFPSLRSLNLWEMYELKEWTQIRPGDFPCLRSLSINKCPLLQNIPLFPSLMEMEFHCCPQLSKIPDLPSLQFLKIDGLQKIRCLDLPQNLTALKKLEISHCGELSSLKGLSKLKSIEMLKIIQCPKLDVGDWQPNLSSELDFEEELDTHDQDIICKSKDKWVCDGQEEDTSMSLEVELDSEIELDTHDQGIIRKSGDKRVRDQEEDINMRREKQVRRMLSLSVVIKVVIWLLKIQKKLQSRKPRMQMISPKSLLYWLFFTSQIETSFSTGNNIVDIHKRPLEIRLFQDSSESSFLPSEIKLELVVLDGDFPINDNWTSDQFNNAIVGDRVGKMQLLTGDVNNIPMRDGVATIGDVQFTDCSSLIRSGQFRIGARVLPGTCDAGKIKEGITNKFIVKEEHSELYKKYYPPVLADEVWRLEEISKDGVYHRRLYENNIHNVQDFLKLWAVNIDQLHAILGMPDKSLEKTINQAMTCDLGNRVYIYSGPNVEILLNSICHIIKITIDGSSYTLQNLPSKKRDYVQQLVLEAYKQWGSLKLVSGGNIGSQSKSKNLVLARFELPRLSNDTIDDRKIDEACSSGSVITVRDSVKRVEEREEIKDYSFLKI